MKWEMGSGVGTGELREKGLNLLDLDHARAPSFENCLIYL